MYLLLTVYTYFFGFLALPGLNKLKRLRDVLLTFWGVPVALNDIWESLLKAMLGVSFMFFLAPAKTFPKTDMQKIYCYLKGLQPHVEIIVILRRSFSVN